MRFAAPNNRLTGWRSWRYASCGWAAPGRGGAQASSRLPPARIRRRCAPPSSRARVNPSVSLMADAGTTPAPDATDPDDDDAVCDAPGVLLRQGRGYAAVPPFLAEARGGRFQALPPVSIRKQAHFVVYTTIVAAPASFRCLAQRPRVSGRHRCATTNLRVLQAHENRIGKRGAHLTITRTRGPRGAVARPRNRGPLGTAALCLEHVSTLRVRGTRTGQGKTRPNWATTRSFVVSLFPRLRWCDGNPVDGRGSYRRTPSPQRRGEVAPAPVGRDSRGRAESGAAQPQDRVSMKTPARGRRRGRRRSSATPWRRRRPETPLVSGSRVTECR